MCLGSRAGQTVRAKASRCRSLGGNHPRRGQGRSRRRRSWSLTAARASLHPQWDADPPVVHASARVACDRRRYRDAECHARGKQRPESDGVQHENGDRQAVSSARWACDLESAPYWPGRTCAGRMPSRTHRCTLPVSSATCSWSDTCAWIVVARKAVESRFGVASGWCACSTRRREIFVCRRSLVESEVTCDNLETVNGDARAVLSTDRCSAGCGRESESGTSARTVRVHAAAMYTLYIFLETADASQVC